MKRIIVLTVLAMLSVAVVVLEIRFMRAFKSSQYRTALYLSIVSILCIIIFYAISITALELRLRAIKSQPKTNEDITKGKQTSLYAIIELVYFLVLHAIMMFTNVAIGYANDYQYRNYLKVSQLLYVVFFSNRSLFAFLVISLFRILHSIRRYGNLKIK
jgi:hypothetical protein